MGTGATRHRTYLVMALEDELNVRLMEMVAYGEGIRYFCAGIEAAAAAAQRAARVSPADRDTTKVSTATSATRERMDGQSHCRCCDMEVSAYVQRIAEPKDAILSKLQFRASHSSDGHQRISSCEVGKIGIISYFESKYQRFIRWVERQALLLIYRILGWYFTPTQATQYCKPYIA
jgi:hypothetical protein